MKPPNKEYMLVMRHGMHTLNRHQVHKSNEAGVVLGICLMTAMVVILLALLGGSQ